MALSFPTNVYGVGALLLQGQSADSTNWISGNLKGWRELDYIPCRVMISGGPATNLPVTIGFDQGRRGIPGIENLYDFTWTSNVIITAGPTLRVPGTYGFCYYDLTITVIDGTPGYVYFYARMAAGAHLNVGSSLHLDGSGSSGVLQIQKPGAAPAHPDLVVVKTGPATVRAGSVITYTLNYTNKFASYDTATRVQLSDALPDYCSFVSNSATGPAHLVGTALYWDLGDLTNGTWGTVSYQVLVGSNAPTTTINNYAQIYSAENDINYNDNVSIVTTTILPRPLPLANPDAYTLYENTTFTVASPGVLANDSDPYGGPLTAILVSGTTHGTLNLSANGSFVYTPTTGYNGKDSFSYRASNGVSNSAPVIVSLTIVPVNDAPLANPDSYVMDEDSTLTIAVPGVLGNDTDPDGDMITAISATAPSHGTLTLNSNGSFVYVPALNYNGIDSFTYRASDGNLTSAPATVTITINPVNDGPVANPDSYVIDEDTTLTISAPGILGNDTDLDGDALISILVSAPAHGTLSLNSDGSFVYRPATNYAGLDTFTYRASDGNLSSAPATVTITINPVNDAPVANPDNYVMDEDTTFAIASPGVLANDSDADGDTLTASLMTAPSHGALSLNRDGSFTYRPATNYNGTDTFTYGASDGALTSPPATVTITINGVNDAPVANPDSYVTDEDSILTIAVPGVLGNDTDPDGDALSAILVTAPSHGTVQLNSDGAFIYQPETNYNGTDTFTYRASDGSLISDPATVTIAINGVNDAPVANPDNYVMDEDSTLTIGIPGVLDNDTDADGNALTATLMTPPSHGTVNLNSNGSFAYVPATNYNGTDTFTYVASDGSLTSAPAIVTITINALNDAPVANPDTYVMNEDSVLNIASPGVLGNDTDVDGDALNAILVSLPVHGTLELNANGSFRYVPNANYNGTDTFTYRASDGTLNSEPATVMITINPVNDAPVANPDSYVMDEDSTLTIPIPGVLANDTDVDGDALTAALVTAPSHGAVTLNNNGSFVYVPANNYNGLDTFTYRASDGSLSSAPAMVSITINAVNDAPVANPDSYVMDEDTVLTIAAPGVLGNDTDVDGDSLTAMVATLPSHGTLSLNGNGAFTYRPATNFHGTDSFTYRASDGLLRSAPATVTITVNAVNDAPIANPDMYLMDEDSTLSVAIPGVLGNDSDGDGDTLTAILISGPAQGTLTLNGDGSFDYTPSTNYNGTDTFRYVASDGSLTSAPATVTITIAEMNYVPVANPDSYVMDEDSVLMIAAPGVLGNDMDAHKKVLTASLATPPTHGTVQLNPDGSFQYIPYTNYNGIETFTYTASNSSLTSAPTTVTITINPVNDAPLANPDNYAMDEDSILTIASPGVLVNDTDVDGHALSAILVAEPVHGMLGFNADGSFTYRPFTNYNGTDTFTYLASDGNLASEAATVTITINPVNDPPVATPDSYVMDEDSTLSIAAPGLLGNDSDVDGDALTANIVTPPSHGTVSLNSNGSFVYIPATDYNGLDTFTYVASDGSLSSAPATVTITITPVNDAPVAAPDSYVMEEDSTLTIAAPGVLGNDSDIDGDALTAILVTNPTHGTVALNADGSFTYRPSTNYNGIDTFTYQASDGRLMSVPVTVTITVNPVNDAPVANPDSYVMDEDATLTIALPGVLGNDTDIDGDALTAALVTAPTHGTVSLNSNGSFVYAPATNYNGTDTFTYQASDGKLSSAPATVTITINAVNDAPAANPDSYVMDEDSTLTIAVPGVLANDTDIDGDILTATALTLPAHGTVQLSSDGSFIYHPVTNYHGVDTFTYRATDGKVSSAPATVTITINAVNDPPMANLDRYEMDEDSTLTITAPGVLGNDTDVDGDALTASLVNSPRHGTVQLNNDGSFVYRPATNYNGMDVFSYSASDGSLTSGPALVVITIKPVNDAPLANPDSYAMDEDTVLTISAPGILANDTDVDKDSLSAILVTGPAHGTIALNADGSFTYRPSANYNGIDTYTYRASDGLLSSAPATVTITINPVNDAPVANPDSYVMDEDSILTIALPGVLVNDTDADGDALTATLVTAPTHGSVTLNTNGSFIYAPATNYNGIDTFSYQASDGNLSSAPATVTITINGVNDVPVANPDSYVMDEDSTLTIAIPGVLANDTDLDGNGLTAILVDNPAHGTVALNANGSFTYKPSTNYHGTDTFRYVASDGSLTSAPATVTITINPVNDAPIANPDNYVMDEDSTLTIAIPGVLSNDTDPDGDALMATLATAPSHGTVDLNGNGSFIYLPAANYNGADTFTYVASDGSLTSAPTTVTITINAVNDAPVANPDNYVMDEDSTLTIAVPGVLANDGDLDGDALSALLVTPPNHGTVTLNSDGAFVYVPAANYNGRDTFTYAANDGSVVSAPATVTITINPVNDAPVANADSYVMDEDSFLTIAAPGVLANDSDVDGDTLNAVVVTSPAHGTLTLNANGSFTYRPSTNYNGTDTFTYRANDGSLSSAPATVTITINPVNDAPVANPDSYVMDEDSTLTIAAPGVLANDSDVDGNPLAAILLSNPAHGTLALNPNGSFIYQPSTNYNGTDTFSYLASDGSLTSAPATVTILINPVNDAPVANPDNYAMDEDSTLTIDLPGVLGNDTDVDGDSLTALLVTAPSHGTVSLNGNGAFVYLPATNYNGIDTFTYRANDGRLSSEAATVTITINPVNDAPVANPDSYVMEEDSTLTITVPGVLGNDTDADGDVLTASLVTPPSHGTVNLNSNGSFVYTPTTNYNGTDSFTYRANDGALSSAPATVTITINPVNDAPVANPDSYVMDEDAILTVATPGVLGNDTDADGDTLTTLLLTAPTHGTVTLNSNGSFVYRPATNYNGTDTFTYRANDGLLSSEPATVTIAINGVNDAPVANPDSYVMDEDAILTVATPGVLGNDTDADDNALIAVLVTPPTHGTVILNSNGSFVYSPATNYNGTDTFTYRANDGTLNSAPATVTITINGLNDAPVANPDAYAMDEDSILTIAVPGVLANDTDADANALTAVLVNGPAHGTLALNADGSFTYHPSTNYTGTDTFLYVASDGSLTSAPALVTITINNFNDAPLAVADSYATDEDSTLRITAPGVLANDSDPDGDSLTAILVTGPQHGTLQLNADGSFAYTPALNFNGIDTFYYRANDGRMDSQPAAVTINVALMNDAPVAAPDSYNLNEDTTLGVPPPGVLANDSDLDGDSLRPTLVGLPAHGTLVLNPDGSFTYVPLANFNGTDNFTYVATDGTLSSSPVLVNLTINPVNDPPSFTYGPDYIVNQNAGLQTVPGWAADISPGPANEANQTVVFHVTSEQSNLFSVPPVISETGTLTYTPSPTARGVATISVVAQDNGGTANGGVDTSGSAIFTITVNGPPVVQIVEPTNNAVFVSPARITVLADVDDPDGPVRQVDFFRGATFIGSVTNAPYIIQQTNVSPGSYRFTAIATDFLGLKGTSAPVNVTVVSNPPLVVISGMTYNPQTDLFEQRVRVTNPSSESYEAVRVLVMNLPPTDQVHNASGKTNGIPYVQVNSPILPGGSVDIFIEYYVPSRIPTAPKLVAQLVSPTTPISVEGAAVPITRKMTLPDGRFLLEFNSTSNKIYYVKYTDDMVFWKTSQPSIRGTGSRVQWVDSGPPVTDPRPLTANSGRFYKVIVMP